MTTAIDDDILRVSGDVIQKIKRCIHEGYYEGPQFTCEHCGKDVPWRGVPEIHKDHVTTPLSYDYCIHCGWSKHVAYMDDHHPVCGAMMKPFFKDEGTRIVLRCTNCGFITDSTTYDLTLEDSIRDDYDMVLGLDGNGYAAKSSDYQVDTKTKQRHLASTLQGR